MRSSGTGGSLMDSFVTITVPGPISATSAAAVSGFMTTRISWPPRRAIQPSRLARIVNQVGRPAMFDGNRFLPLTGIPIWKRARSRTLFAVWLPDPLTVATWMLKSLTTGFTNDGSWGWLGRAYGMRLTVEAGAGRPLAITHDRPRPRTGSRTQAAGSMLPRFQTFPQCRSIRPTDRDAWWK